MSVNLYNATTDTLKNVAGDIVNPKSVNNTIAPAEETTTASRAYNIGEQFFLNDVLYKATDNIAQGDTITVGTNCSASDKLTEQIDSLNNDLGSKSSASAVTGNDAFSKIATLNNDLSDNGSNFKYGYQRGKAGYYLGSTFYPFKSGLETELWTNSNPSSTFSSQIVNLSDDINNYDSLKIYFKNSASDVDSNLIDIVDVVNFVGSSNTKSNAVGSYSSSGYNLARKYFYNSNTSINFSGCQVIGASGGSQSNLIPIKICGIG